jgi:hypothetical protein
MRELMSGLRRGDPTSLYRLAYLSLDQSLDQPILFFSKEREWRKPTFGYTSFFVPFHWVGLANILPLGIKRR